MYLKQKIPRSSFLSFFDDFRYAGATIVALCSQGLRGKNLVCSLGPNNERRPILELRS